MKTSIVAVPLDWLERAVYETSFSQKGHFKQAWAMKLIRSGHRCQLPRGFVKNKKPFFVGRDTRPQQHRNLGQQIACDLRAIGLSGRKDFS